MKTNFNKIILLFLVSLVLPGVYSRDDEKLPPNQVITYKVADDLEEEFKRTRARIINDSLGYEDTREFWFALDSLKKYIAYIEYEAEKRQLSNLGVRVYFGAYPKNDNEAYPAGYSTVFFVPTAQNASSQLKQGFAPVQAENENIEGLSALNYGHGGIPPNDL